MRAPPRPRRSVLYVPASNPRALEKAAGLDVDALIVDLEDSVAPDAKAEARAGAVAALGASGLFPERMEIIVRVNALDGALGREDLAAVAPFAPAAVLVPKILSAASVRAAGEAVASLCGPATQLWAMMEMPGAVLEALAVARVAAEGPLSAFVVGINDLAKEMHATLAPHGEGEGRAVFRPALSAILLAARAEGLLALDGVYNFISDGEGFAAECAQGRAFGFDGKTLIHPTQVAPANAAFSPRAEDVAWARRVVEAYSGPGKDAVGALKLDGQLVERLHLEGARRLVELAESLAGRAKA
ncbi:MAG: CoA ester lyase [Alphaproteobacteria bacterium]|nr:CoA ester lyase [Alphaproteobacteria bacterium]